MLMALVAGLLGLLGLTSVAGAVTLNALSHPVPTEIWQVATGSLSALAALLAGHGIANLGGNSGGVTNVTSVPVEPVPSTDTKQQAVVNGEGPPTPPAAPAGLSPRDVKGGHPDLSSLPRPPADRSKGRDRPPEAQLPPPPRVHPARRTSPARRR